MVYFVTCPPEGADKYVMRNISPQIPDMGIIIDRWPATVKTGLIGLPRLEKLCFSAQSVKKGKRHGLMVCENRGKDKNTFDHKAMRNKKEVRNSTTEYTE
jgi:hypothetical protein